MHDLVPRGVGVFLRTLSRRRTGTPTQAAKKAADHGLSWVALMAMGLVGDPPRERVQGLGPIADCGQAFREAGVEPWVWFFPLAVDPEAATAAAGRALEACRGRGLILDVERPYARRPVACRRLVSASLDQLGEDQGIATTSYPLARFHPAMPWEEMVVGTGMPQTYTISPASARRAVAEWRERGHTSIVPVGPAYGPRSEGRLLSYLRAAYLARSAPVDRAPYRAVFGDNVRFDAPDNLPAIRMGNSSQSDIGDWVLAVGSPFGLDGTVTKTLAGSYHPGGTAYDMSVTFTAATNTWALFAADAGNTLVSQGSVVDSTYTGDTFVGTGFGFHAFAGGGASGRGGQLDSVGFNIVPEPSSTMLLGGFGLLALLRRRR